MRAPGADLLPLPIPSASPLSAASSQPASAELLLPACLWHPRSLPVGSPYRVAASVTPSGSPSASLAWLAISACLSLCPQAGDTLTFSAAVSVPLATEEWNSRTLALTAGNIIRRQAGVATRERQRYLRATVTVLGTAADKVATTGLGGVDLSSGSGCHTRTPCLTFE